MMAVIDNFLPVYGIIPFLVQQRSFQGVAKCYG
jgi:hypothetical protein